MMRALLVYTALTLGIVIGGGALLSTVVFDGEAARHAVVVSGSVALVVQLFAFAILRLVARDPRNAIAGWGLGALLRMATLLVYGLLVVKALGLAPVAALVSLATFFFLSMLVEPLALNVKS
jgi:hypothetical protein